MRLCLGVLLLAGLVVDVSEHRAEEKSIAEKSSGGAYQLLMDEYKKALKESDAIFAKARTDEDRKAVRASFHKWRGKFLDRVLMFAESNPKDHDVLLALFFVIHPDNSAEPGQIEKTIELILKNHLTSDRLINPPILQMVEDFPAAEILMHRVLENNPHHAVQAQACLRQGQMIKRRAAVSPPQRSAELTQEAERLFERVVNKYSDVKDVAHRARAELFQMRHLIIGKTLPEITGKDSDDKDLKLSDYRGKVVVVNFWAEWCEPCMKMVPHERALVKRLEGKPFALVGINRNESRESLKKCEQKHEITWRSFFDGLEGPISTGHNIQRMPTIYVLDARGVIRYMDVRGESLDKAVDHLLAEMEEGMRK